MKFFFKLLITLFLVVSPFFSYGQPLLQDTYIQEVVGKGMDKMYNFEFDAAEEQYKIVQKKYPKHPAYYFLMCLNMGWKGLYYNKFDVYFNDQLSFLNTSLELSKAMLEKPETKVEGVFFCLATYSALALYYSQKNNNWESVNCSRKAYGYLKDGMKYKDKYNEFYFSSGIYNYFIVKYPENHPSIRPFMLFFAGGDKTKGIAELEYGSQKAFYTKTECLFYLSVIYIKYENTPEKALPHTKQLVQKYPKNFFFLSKHTEALLYTGNYREGEIYSYQLYKSKEKFFEMTSYVFYGILNEKHYNRLDTATAYYNQALNYCNNIYFPTKEFKGIIYAGLGRIAHRKGNTKQAVEYYKKAKEYADYTYVMKETEAYLAKYD